MNSDDKTKQRPAVTLENAGISAQLARVLEAHSIGSLADLCRTTAAALLQMDGVGAESLRSLRKTLLFYGLGLKDDPSPGTPAFEALGIEELDEPNYPWSH